MNENLFVCPKCGKDYKDHINRVWIMKEVHLCGFGNIICYECKRNLENKIRNLARRFLKT